jgi:hypothetical protein
MLEPAELKLDEVKHLIEAEYRAATYIPFRKRLRRI